MNSLTERREERFVPYKPCGDESKNGSDEVRRVVHMIFSPWIEKYIWPLSNVLFARWNVKTIGHLLIFYEVQIVKHILMFYLSWHLLVQMLLKVLESWGCVLFTLKSSVKIDLMESCFPHCNFTYCPHMSKSWLSSGRRYHWSRRWGSGKLVTGPETMTLRKNVIRKH